MTAFKAMLRRNERGAAAIEFAIAAPVVLVLMIGLLQVAILFFANAGVQQAVETGARYATIYPTPSDSAITTKIEASKFGLNPAYITGPTVTHGTNSEGVDYVDITMSYAVPLDFVFFQTPPITLTRTRRAYTP